MILQNYYELFAIGLSIFCFPLTLAYVSLKILFEIEFQLLLFATVIILTERLVKATYKEHKDIKMMSYNFV